MRARWRAVTQLPFAPSVKKISKNAAAMMKVTVKEMKLRSASQLERKKAVGQKSTEMNDDDDDDDDDVQM